MKGFINTIRAEDGQEIVREINGLPTLDLRAAVKKTAIKAALANEVDRVTYDNFKSSVDDDPLHNAYTRVWTAMASLQPQAPYSGMFAPVKVKPAFRNRQNDKKPPAKKRKRPEQMR